MSVRSPDDLYYRDELVGPEVTVVYTRRTPPGWSRPAGRLADGDLAPLGDLGDGTTAYVCGSAGFADAASHLLVEAGVPVERIRVERFGPTG